MDEGSGKYVKVLCRMMQGLTLENSLEPFAGLRGDCRGHASSSGGQSLSMYRQFLAGMNSLADECIPSLEICN